MFERAVKTISQADITTLEELCQYSAQEGGTCVVMTSRGPNGGDISTIVFEEDQYFDDYADDTVCLIEEADDQNAWKRAREACTELRRENIGIGEPTLVFVGVPDESGLQKIFCW